MLQAGWDYEGRKVKNRLRRCEQDGKEDENGAFSNRKAGLLDERGWDDKGWMMSVGKSTVGWRENTDQKYSEEDGMEV